jgi:diguanylate cyclase (GGDEF)-like protein/PAS domain S-box-containing protein
VEGATSGPVSTVLIVDDEENNRKLLQLLLRAEGYLTVMASSAEEALSAISRSEPDLILLDIMMPGMNGYELATLLKADSATLNIPIIMLTAQMDRGVRVSGLKAGAEEFLTKPFESTELCLRVRNLLRLKAFSDFQKNHSAILEQEVQSRSADLHRFRVAMDATTDAITLMNRRTMHFVEVNATACRMLGYTREEMLKIGPAQLGAGTSQQLEHAYDALIAGDAAHVTKETRLRRRDGSRLLVEADLHAERCGADWIIVGVIRDITERKEAESRLIQVAHYDALTGLPNRTLFYKNLTRMLSRAAERGWSISLLCIDLDHFKNVNDTRGHALGDELIRQVSNRLVQCVRIRDTVARLGGDEFGVILADLQRQQRAHHVAGRVREILQLPFRLNENEVTVTASTGIACFPGDAADAETLVKYADTAMYQAKQAGRDTFRIFTNRMNIDALARLDLETALRKAVDNEEFVLHYQPKMDIKTGRICGVEALLRWQRPCHGLVPPGNFIPVLEDTGLIVPVGRWVISSACKQIETWLAGSIGAMNVSVNVAGRQFVDGDLERDVSTTLCNRSIAANLLELELTESSLMANTESTVKTLQNLRDVGVGISIDDFGTGYSSLAYLRRFPVDKLKIDIAFIRGITTSADDAAIVLAIIRMAHTLKLEVIAEGVETTEQLAYLRKHHCDQIQGYYLSKPLPVPELEKLLTERSRRPAAKRKAGRSLRVEQSLERDASVARGALTAPKRPPVGASIPEGSEAPAKRKQASVRD